ncbi:MAG: cytochrome c maturation protein CcmE [Candidatus Dormiibacterota bacterium]
MIKLVILGVLLAAGVGFFIFHSTQGNAEYYETIQEMHANPQSSDVRVVGVIEPGVQRSQGGTQVAFWMRDSTSRMQVAYQGTLPDIFKPGIQVVVQGHPNAQGIFQASELQTKCPSHFSASPAPQGAATAAAKT